MFLTIMLYQLPASFFQQIMLKRFRKFIMFQIDLDNFNIRPIIFQKFRKQRQFFNQKFPMFQNTSVNAIPTFHFLQMKLLFFVQRFVICVDVLLKRFQ